ncbi:MAG: TIGR00730 family Rossman fold protein [Bacteroidetes bacterium]|nr:TIGR00730 family Rossman fold protein [Bacteroidota bacterium]
MKRICVFCGSSTGNSASYRKAAIDLANFLSDNKLGLVYGGAKVGLMKILADALLEKNGEVIGVMPKLLINKEVAHDGLSHFVVVESMAERKASMLELSDAFIALPGGFGTLDELSEILTYNQLHITDKPMGLLNVDGYFDRLLDFIDHGVEAGFIRPEHRQNLIVSNSIEDLMIHMENYRPVEMGKWIEAIQEESNNKKKNS